MGRMSRAEILDPSEVAICHVFARVVHRCFLLGNDPVTGRHAIVQSDFWMRNRGSLVRLSWISIRFGLP